MGHHFLIWANKCSKVCLANHLHHV